MLKIFRFFKNQYLLNRRVSADEERQQAEGYSITFNQEGPERYITYIEDGREIDVIAEFTLMNDVVLFTDSLARWSRPNGEPLSDFDYLKVVNRMIRYLSCWGEVILDSRELSGPEDLKMELDKAGIPYEELPGGIIHYSVDIEGERKQKGGWFDR